MEQCGEEDGDEDGEASCHRARRLHGSSELRTRQRTIPYSTVTPVTETDPPPGDDTQRVRSEAFPTSRARGSAGHAVATTARTGGRGAVGAVTADRLRAGAVGAAERDSTLSTATTTDRRDGANSAWRMAHRDRSRRAGARRVIDRHARPLHRGAGVGRASTRSGAGASTAMVCRRAPLVALARCDQSGRAKSRSRDVSAEHHDHHLLTSGAWVCLFAPSANYQDRRPGGVLGVASAGPQLAATARLQDGAGAGGRCLAGGTTAMGCAGRASDSRGVHPGQAIAANGGQAGVVAQRRLLGGDAVGGLDGQLQSTASAAASAPHHLRHRRLWNIGGGHAPRPATFQPAPRLGADRRHQHPSAVASVFFRVRRREELHHRGTEEGVLHVVGEQGHRGQPGTRRPLPRVCLIGGRMWRRHTRVRRGWSLL
eukprot:ctg_1688.g456